MLISYYCFQSPRDRPIHPPLQQQSPGHAVDLSAEVADDWGSGWANEVVVGILVAVVAIGMGCYLAQDDGKVGGAELVEENQEFPVFVVGEDH
jgi:hypothetical protein